MSAPRRIHWGEDEMSPDVIVTWRAGIQPTSERWERTYIAADADGLMLVAKHEAEVGRLRSALMNTIKLTRPQLRALQAFDGPEPTDPSNEQIVGMNGVGNVRMVMNRLCEMGLCIRREHLNDDEGYRYELTEEGSCLVKLAAKPRHYVIGSNA